MDLHVFILKKKVPVRLIMIGSGGPRATSLTRITKAVSPPYLMPLIPLSLALRAERLRYDLAEHSS